MTLHNLVLAEPDVQKLRSLLVRLAGVETATLGLEVRPCHVSLSITEHHDARNARRSAR